VAGADANYLVLAGILAGAIVGIEREMVPSDPCGDAYTLKLGPAAGLGLAPTHSPRESWKTSRRSCRDMVACKPGVDTFAAQVTDFEYETYLDMV
jgi:glutamine synthetase